jgi:hypothetical protein
MLPLLGTKGVPTEEEGKVAIWLTRRTPANTRTKIKPTCEKSFHTANAT